MFTNLSERFTKIIKNLSGKGRITKENIENTLREIRIALLEADVSLSVVKKFLDHIQTKALGVEVIESLTPGQALIKIVHNELIALMGNANDSLNLKKEPPVVILLAGLQGSGKTTTTAKLAKRLKEIEKKSVLLVSVDVYRPAAILQLKTLANQLEIEFFATDTAKPEAIITEAITFAKNKLIDIVIIDTAGRSSIDDVMMEEIKRLHAIANPLETLFVVDSMTGQDAVVTAENFNKALPLTGIILTKTDGDARGGAALSIRDVTGKPIKFLGIGEKVDALEPFYPDRLASRILGMGDIVTLVEEVQRNVDQKQAEKLAKKIKKGKTFNLEDFRDQLKQIGKMGGMMNIMSKLPQMGKLSAIAKDNLNDKNIIEIEAIINSMTPKERRFPGIINGSRKRRIAKGAGTDIQGVNRLLKQFTMMQKMMRKVSQKGGIGKLMRGLPQGLLGGGGNVFPPF